MARHGHLGAAIRHFRRLARDERGVVVVLMTLVMGVIFGFVGLAADASAWYTIQMRMQTAADAAALNAALTYFGGGGGYQEAAELDAGRNGFVHEVDGVEVDAELIESRIRVTITGPGGLFTFSRLFNDDPATIVAAAEAGRVTSDPLCMMALHPSDGQSLIVNSNAQINAPGCKIQVNSTAQNGLYVPSGRINAAEVCVGASSPSNYGDRVNPPPVFCPAELDPLEVLSEPSASGTCVEKWQFDDETATISPGNYCNGLQIKGKSHIHVMPGTYYIGKDGDKGLWLDASKHDSPNSDRPHLYMHQDDADEGAMFFLTPGARLEFNADSKLRLWAMKEGDYKGILFFGSRATSNNAIKDGEHVVLSNAGGLFDGAFYFKRHKIRIDSNPSVQSDQACIVMIANKIEFNSNSTHLMTNLDACLNLLPGQMRPTSLITLLW